VFLTKLESAVDFYQWARCWLGVLLRMVADRVCINVLVYMTARGLGVITLSQGWKDSALWVCRLPGRAVTVPKSPRPCGNFYS
jgi:hypothetical protein